MRAGLPSDVEESLQKTIDIAVYVPDRKPFVRFSGKAYVLPSRGQQGIPLVSVNTDKVEVEVYRIGDRSLVSALQSGDLQRQLSSYEVENIKSIAPAARSTTAPMDSAAKAQRGGHDGGPRHRRGRQAEAGRLRDDRQADAEAEGRLQFGRATQWFIVSDLGLTAFSGNDGVHAFVRSLADRQPFAGVNVKLDRPQQRGAGHGQGRRQRVCKIRFRR